MPLSSATVASSPLLILFLSCFRRSPRHAEPATTGTRSPESASETVVRAARPCSPWGQPSVTARNHNDGPHVEHLRAPVARRRRVHPLGGRCRNCRTGGLTGNYCVPRRTARGVAAGQRVSRPRRRSRARTTTWPFVDVSCVGSTRNPQVTALSCVESVGCRLNCCGRTADAPAKPARAYPARATPSISVKTAADSLCP